MIDMTRDETVLSSSFSPLAELLFKTCLEQPCEDRLPIISEINDLVTAGYLHDFIGSMGKWIADIADIKAIVLIGAQNHNAITR
jgi:hypothetical protein